MDRLNTKPSPTVKELKSSLAAKEQEVLGLRKQLGSAQRDEDELRKAIATMSSTNRRNKKLDLWRNRSDVCTSKKPKWPHAYYLNLDRRTDRMHRLTDALARVGWPSSKVHRVPALDARRDALHAGPYSLPPGNALAHDRFEGALACTLSHLRALRRAFADGHNIAAVFEDDFDWADHVAGGHNTLKPKPARQNPWPQSRAYSTPPLASPRVQPHPWTYPHTGKTNVSCLLQDLVDARAQWNVTLLSCEPMWNGVTHQTGTVPCAAMNARLPGTCPLYGQMNGSYFGQGPAWVVYHNIDPFRIRHPGSQIFGSLIS